MIYIDNREDAKVYKAFDKKQVEYKIEQLPVGDIVYKNLCIERKEISDFYSSVLSKRIFTQSLNMNKNFKNNYIIIVGDIKTMFYNKYMKFNQNIFYAAIASLSCRPEYNIKIIQVKNNNDLVYMTQKLIEKIEDDSSPEHVLRIKHNNTDDVKLNFLASIPGLSIGRADLILKEFDVKLIFNSKNNLKEIKEIKGFGTKLCNEVDKYVFRK